MLHLLHNLNITKIVNRHFFSPNTSSLCHYDKNLQIRQLREESLSNDAFSDPFSTKDPPVVSGHFSPHFISCTAASTTAPHIRGAVSQTSSGNELTSRCCHRPKVDHPLHHVYGLFFITCREAELSKARDCVGAEHFLMLHTQTTKDEVAGATPAHSDLSPRLPMGKR